MNNPIIEMSFIEDDISSRINLTAEELKREHLPPQDISDRYDVNSLVILPVNPYLIFSYWFTTQALKDELISRYQKFRVVLRLLEEGLEVGSIEVLALEGSWYVNHHAPFKKIRAILGIDVDGNFHPVLHSNEIVMPSDRVFIESEQHWYNRKDNTVRLKKGDIHFIDQLNLIAQEKEKSSYQTGPSSIYLP